MVELKDHPGYAITEDGTVYSLPKRYNGYQTKELIGHTTRHGYRQVKLGRTSWISVHRLVAVTFIDNQHNLPCVNHIDGDKSNNHVSNLEWCEYDKNIHHSITLGLTKTKLKEGDVEKILLLRSEGKTLPEIASLFGIHKDYAGRICRNEQRPTHLNK